MTPRRFPWSVLAAFAALKLAILLAAHQPAFFLGDSQSYIATALWGWVPPDRSYVYGAILGLLCNGAHSLLPLLVFQSLCGALAGALLTAALERHFAVRRFLAVACGALFVLDPFQLHYERAVMTETLAMALLALTLAALLAHLETRRLRTLVLGALLAASVVLIRQAYLPVLAPLLAIAGVLPRRPAVQRLAAAALAAVTFGGALSAYVHAMSAWKQVAPQLSRADGYFLLSYYAPLLRPGDFPDDERKVLFAPSPWPLERPGIEGYSPQMFAPEGLVDRLSKHYGVLEGNRVARESAMLTARRHPVALASLALWTFGQYFEPAAIRGSFHSGLALNRDLPPDFTEALRNFYGLETDAAYSRRGTWITRIIVAAWPLHYLRLVLPLLLVLAALVRRTPPLLLVGAAVALHMGSLCFLTVMDDRYLHSGSWFAALAAGVLAEWALRSRRAAPA